MNIDRKFATTSVLLDFFKVSDFVSHSLLCSKLKTLVRLPSTHLPHRSDLVLHHGAFFGSSSCFIRSFTVLGTSFTFSLIWCRTPFFFLTPLRWWRATCSSIAVFPLLDLALLTVIFLRIWLSAPLKCETSQCRPLQISKLLSSIRSKYNLSSWSNGTLLLLVYFQDVSFQHYSFVKKILYNLSGFNAFILDISVSSSL